MNKLYYLLLALFIASCSPKIRVEAPDKPIEINLNVKIQHSVQVKIDKELDSLIEDSDNLF